MYFILFLIHINDKKQPQIKNLIMKKVILTIAIGVVLTSCSKGLGKVFWKTGSFGTLCKSE